MAIRSINLDNSMGATLRGIKRELLPLNMKLAIVEGEVINPTGVDEASRRALLTGIAAFCGAYPLATQITISTRKYERALSSEVKVSKIFLDIIASSTALVGTVFSLLPAIVPSRQVDEQFTEELRLKYFGQWGVVWTTATLATIVSLKIFASTCLPDEETNRSLLNRLWTELDGRAPEALIEAGDNLRHQFATHALTYSYLCQRFHLEPPRDFKNIISLYSRH
ncbi:MAG: hypothetical protein NTX49_09490 [Chlamydiae bacterium]|nr:hypothetical protein [Chlamydiota bacterium]